MHARTHTRTHIHTHTYIHTCRLQLTASLQAAPSPHLLLLLQELLLQLAQAKGGGSPLCLLHVACQQLAQALDLLLLCIRAHMCMCVCVVCCVSDCVCRCTSMKTSACFLSFNDNE